MKVKYNWELMHGDADHYDKESLTLIDENDIKFFDFVIDLEFESHDCEGFIFLDEDDDYMENNKKEQSPQYQNLIELFKQTTMYSKNLKFYQEYYPNKILNNNDIYEQINEYLRDQNFIKSDVTCDGYHYAEIRSINKKEIIEKVGPKDAQLLKYALEKLGLTKEQLIENYNQNGGK